MAKVSDDVVETVRIGAPSSNVNILSRTCCATRDVQAPISIPIYNPVCYGQHIAVNHSGIVVPQHQFVFASPAGRTTYGCIQPNACDIPYLPTGTIPNVIHHEYIHSVHPTILENSSSIVQGPLVSSKSGDSSTLNATNHRCVSDSVKGDSTGAVLRESTWNCCNKQTADEVSNEIQQEATTENVERSNENETVETHQQVTEDNNDASKCVKKQTMCNLFFNTCAFEQGEDNPGFGKGTTNVYHVNALFRGETLPEISQTVPNRSENSIFTPSNWWPCCQSAERTLPSVPLNQSSIYSQYSIPIQPNQGWFSTCMNQMPAICGKPRLVALPTQSSLGLRDLYATPSICTPITQRTLISNRSNTFNPIEPQISIGGLPYPGVAVDSPQTGTLPLISSQPSAVVPQPSVVESVPTPAKKLVNDKPVNFKLHAIEVHQFVPIPNMPGSKFVDAVTPQHWIQNNGVQIYQHSYGSSNPNSFFNSNTTGMMAPMMGNIVRGIAADHMPDIYAMPDIGNLNIQRLQTQESQINVSSESKCSEDAVEVTNENKVMTTNI